MPDTPTERLQHDALGPCVATCLTCGSAIWEREGEDFREFLNRYQTWADHHARCAPAPTT